MDRIINSAPYALLGLYLGKLMFVQAVIADGPIMAVLAALIVLQEYKIRDSQMDQLRKDIADAKEAAVQAKADADAAKTHVAGIKLGQGRSTMRF